MILKVSSDDEAGAEAIIFTSGRHKKGDENEPVQFIANVFSSHSIMSHFQRAGQEYESNASLFSLRIHRPSQEQPSKQQVLPMKFPDKIPKAVSFCR
jgi:hypothetical protein